MRALWIVCLLTAAAAAQDDPLATLLKEVADPDRTVRARAAKGLGRTSDERALAALRTALEDKDEPVRIAAAASLAKLKAADARAIEVLAGGLRSASWYDRWQACLSLGAIGPPAEAAVPALVDAALDPALDIPREALRALGAVGPKDERALKGLARLLDATRPADRLYILGLLESAKRGDLASAWLADEARTNRRGLRSRAQLLLRNTGEPAVRALLEDAKGMSIAYRVAAIDALGWLKAKEAADLVLAAAADDESADVRRAALNAIGNLKPEGGSRVAVAALKDPNELVRFGAAYALGELKVEEKAAGPGLVRLFGAGAPNAYMREILEATGFRGLAAFVRNEPIKDDAHWKCAFRLRLGRSDVEALNALVAEVEDKDHGKALVAALKETLAPGQDDLLIESLRVGDAPLRRTAAVLLGHLVREPWRYIGDLEKALNDEDGMVRDAATVALLRWALDDKEETVRDAAKAALERGKR